MLTLQHFINLEIIDPHINPLQMKIVQVKILDSHVRIKGD